VFEGALHGVEKRQGIIRLLGDRRLRKFPDVHIIDVHPGQKNERRSHSGELTRNAQAVVLGSAQLQIEYSEIEFRRRRRSAMVSDAVATDATCFAPASSSIC